MNGSEAAVLAGTAVIVYIHRFTRVSLAAQSGIG